MNNCTRKFAALFSCFYCSLAAAQESEKPPPENKPPAVVPISDAKWEWLRLHPIRQLTFVGAKNGEAYFAPDGRRIVFQGVREPELKNPFYRIYTMDLATGVSRRVSSGKGRTTCSYFHPKKERLIFASSHLDPEAGRIQLEEIEKLKQGPPARYQWTFDPLMDIFETDLDGRNPVRLTEAPGYDAECAYSPDGTKIVFCSCRDGDGEIYVMDAGGKNPVRLTREVGYDGGPFFSPDGKQIVWRHFTADQKSAEVWLMQADGTEKRPVTKLGALAWAPFFHPSGHWIAFASNHQDPGFEIYAIRRDGSDLTRLTFAEGFDGLPVFSPDGRRLMWTSSRGGDGSHLYLADVFLDGFMTGMAPQDLPVERSPIDLDRLRAHVKYFSDPVEAGRLARGDAPPILDYLARHLVEAGVVPPGEKQAGGPAAAVDFQMPDVEAIEGKAPGAIRVAGTILPSPMTWKQAAAAESGVRFLLLLSPIFNAEAPPVEKGARREIHAGPLMQLACGLEVLREMSAVARFRGLKLGLLYLAFETRGLGEKTSYAVLLKNLIPPDRVAAVVCMDWPTGLAGEMVLQGARAGEAWRYLVERLAAANPHLSFIVRDEISALHAAAHAAPAEKSREDAFLLSLLERETSVPSLVLTGNAGQGASADKANPRNEPFTLEALRDRATVALGAVYRLATGDLEIKYRPFDPATTTVPQKRPYLGTRPKYQGDGTGVVLESIYPGSPAEAADLKSGDKIVRLGALEVKDAEGYLHALETLKPGEKTRVGIEREGKPVEIEITVGAR